MLRPKSRLFYSRVVLAAVLSSVWFSPGVLAAGDDPIEDIVIPIASPFDSRDYRVLTLENGLQALLVSDPDADKAAASMNVRVGSAQIQMTCKGLLISLNTCCSWVPRRIPLQRLSALYF